MLQIYDIEFYVRFPFYIRINIGDEFGIEFGSKIVSTSFSLIIVLGAQHFNIHTQ